MCSGYAGVSTDSEHTHVACGSRSGTQSHPSTKHARACLFLIFPRWFVLLVDCGCWIFRNRAPSAEQHVDADSGALLETPLPEIARRKRCQQVKSRERNSVVDVFGNQVGCFTDQLKCKYSQLHMSYNQLLSRPSTHVEREREEHVRSRLQQHQQPHKERVGALPQSHPGLCGTPVGPGKDTHGTPVPDREGRGWPTTSSTKTTTDKRQQDTGKP